MTEPSGAGVIEHFSTLTDPRVERTKHHQLVDIVVIAILAVMCGADGWVEIEVFGRTKQAWLKQFLALPHGIPSHDTFGRVFARLDPEQFAQCFLAWTEAVRTIVKDEVIAIDGKTLRRTADSLLGQSAIHMVSAWATANRLVLGQIKVADHSNEIPALPKLLKVLAVKGCIVTVDAMGCQKEVAETIQARGGECVLAVKDNQEHLHAEVNELFQYAQETKFRDVQHDYCRTVNKGHGRLEIRRCWVIDDPDFLAYLRQRAAWKGLTSIIMVDGERRLGDKITHQIRYYISSLKADAKRILAAVRGHWGIENSVHWVLDMAFREDEVRIRQGHSPHNFAILHHIALNLLHHERTAKVGVKGKRLKCALDEAYLLKVLLG
jgi:predicted transposase YbfD/YdcC